MAYEHRELSGSLFYNSYKEDGDNKPDLVGELKINGKLWRMAGWKKETANGETWLSLKASEPQQKPVAQTQSPMAEDDSDAPF